MTHDPQTASSRQPDRGCGRVEIIFLLTIALGGAVVLWQRRALTQLASIRHAPPAAAAHANLLAARQRADALEKQLAGKQMPPPPATTAAPHAGQLKRLQLRVEAARSQESIRTAFGPLIKALGLDADTAARFEGILGQERLAARDAVVAARAEGVQTAQGYKTAVEEAISQYDEQISAVLSPAGFAQFDAYRQTLPEQETVASLTARLSGTPTPLNDSQQAQLVQMIDQMEPPAYHQNQSFLSAIGMDEAPLTSAMISAAPAILSPPQARALQAIQASWIARAQLQQALHQRAP